MGIFLEIILVFLIIRFVFRIVFPTLSAFNNMKRKVDNMSEKMKEQQPKSEQKIEGEYIDFEEIKK